MLREYMIGVGFTDKDIDKIINTFPVCNYKEETLLKKIDEVYKFLLNNGYVSKEILRMIKRFPQIVVLTSEYIEQKIKDIMS